MATIKGAGKKVLEKKYGKSPIPKTPSLQRAGEKWLEQRYGKSPIPNVPSLKTAGQRWIKSRYGKKTPVLDEARQRAGMQSVAKKYSAAPKKAPVNVIVPEVPAYDTPRMTVINKKGGWSRVTYTDPAAGRPVTFSIRSNVVKKAFDKPRNKWYQPEEAVYSFWINDYKKGMLYSKRRKVEGALKMARKRHPEDVTMWEKILTMSDEKVAQAWDEWVEMHSDEEIIEYFDNSDKYDDDGIDWS